MRHDSHDDSLKDLEAALRITPSPEFAVRVRERVRQQPASRWTFGISLPMAVGAMVAIVIAGASIAWLAEHRAWPSIPSARVNASAVVSPAAVPIEGRVQPSVPVVASAQPIQRERVSRVASHGHEPDVLVPDDERVALNRLLFAVRDGRAAVPAPIQALEDEDGNLLEPQSIEIPLLKPIEPLPGTPADGVRSIKK